jgi:hypothetical protein
MPIPRYYRLSVSTGTNCPHDTLQTCLLRGFTFTFTVRIIAQFLYQDGPRAVQTHFFSFCTSRDTKTEQQFAQ